MKKHTHRKLRHCGGAAALVLAIFTLPGCKKEADPVPIKPPPSTPAKTVETNEPVAKDTTMTYSTNEVLTNLNIGSVTNTFPHP